MAYKILSVPEKRKVYDEYGMDGLEKLVRTFPLRHTRCSLWYRG